MLHHRYKGRRLNDDQRQRGQRFLDEKMDRYTKIEYENFKSEADCSENEMISKKCSSPVAYWLYWKRRFPNLVNFALKLFLMPASTAQLEGLFSNWTYVHNLFRNQLEDDKSSMLLDIYYTLKQRELAFYRYLNREYFK